MKTPILVSTIIIILVCTIFVVADDANPVNKSEIETNSQFLLPDWDKLPFKDIRPLDSGYINRINNQYGLDWDSDPFFAPDKCLSYSAATMVDWYRLQTGKPLTAYPNYVNNRTENGTNPRVLESIYFTHDSSEPNFDYARIGAFLPDPITGEHMPYDIKGFGEIVTGSYPLWVNEDDVNLGSGYKLSSTPETYPEMDYFKSTSLFGGHFIFSPTYSQVKTLIDKYGIVYAQIENVLLFNQPIHAADIIGYGQIDCDRDGVTENVFWMHDSYYDDWDGVPSNKKNDLLPGLKPGVSGAT